MRWLLLLGCCVSVSYTQDQNPKNIANLHNGLSERIGNFSIEVLYHTANTLEDGQNFIMSPITIWNVLAVIAEGASGLTKTEIVNAIRLNTRLANNTRQEFKEIYQWLVVNTDTIKLAKVNTMFVNTKRLPLKDFQDIAKKDYDTSVVPLDFSDSVNTANVLNNIIANVTKGLINKIVEPDYFKNTEMVLTSALYFKGQWTVPFNTTSTSKMPFFDSNGTKIGEVNMMYNRYTYPFSNFKELQARVIELPYGKENRLSMLIMLPYHGVSVEEMFLNFQKVNMDTFFNELRVSKEQFSDEEVDCYIPRFKIESNLDMSNVLKTRFGIERLFDPAYATLPFISRVPLHVTKIVHKAKIEVTEDGTSAAGVTVSEFTNRMGVLPFHANRPFTYVIIEKVTNSIVFGGFYKEPSLY